MKTIKVKTSNSVRLHELINANIEKGKVIDMYSTGFMDGILHSEIIVENDTDTTKFEKAVDNSLSVAIVHIS